jgi:Mrp family chromosome partitioning ATPase
MNPRGKFNARRTAAGLFLPLETSAPHEAPAAGNLEPVGVAPVDKCGANGTWVARIRWPGGYSYVVGRVRMGLRARIGREGLVNAPLTGNRGAGAPTLRTSWEPSQSLALGRLPRAVRRQALLAVVVFVAILGLGVAYDLTGGVRPLTAALFWAPLALAVALGLALIRELGRNTVTSLSSLGKHRGYSVLGAAPELTERALRQLPPDRRTPLGCLAFQPASPFATAFRDLQGAVGDKSLVAFVGSLAGEGATTSALCTAISAAQQGRSTIIIDCDLRRRTLTKIFEGEAELGVLEASEEPDNWRAYIVEEDETGVHLMPAAHMRSPWRSSLLSSPGFPRLIARLREAYDLVVLDCPPALNSAEGSIIAGLASRIVVVTAWDRTPLNAVRNTMRALKRQTKAATSVYVNRVPPGYRFGRLRPD